jgi:serine/threonine protein phosphatase PrpC
MHSELHLDTWELTDTGRQREHNEDHVGSFVPDDLDLLSERGRLFVVADGMGGHLAGEVASKYAVEQVLFAYYNGTWDLAEPSLIRAIQGANTDLYEESQNNPERSGMGTTLVAAALTGSQLTVANVGDSRATLVRDGSLRHITRDHSWVADRVAAGLLTEEEARTHPSRHIITRSLGNDSSVDVDTFIETVQPGDAVVLCTDGLSGLVSDSEMLEVVSHSDARSASVELVQLANDRGGPDNITVIVIKVREPAAARQRAMTTPLRLRGVVRPKRRRWIAAVLLVLLVVVGVYFGYQLMYLRRGLPEALPFLNWDQIGLTQTSTSTEEPIPTAIGVGPPSLEVTPTIRNASQTTQPGQ